MRWHSGQNRKAQWYTQFGHERVVYGLCASKTSRVLLLLGKWYIREEGKNKEGKEGGESKKQGTKTFNWKTKQLRRIKLCGKMSFPDNCHLLFINSMKNVVTAFPDLMYWQRSCITGVGMTWPLIKKTIYRGDKHPHQEEIMLIYKSLETAILSFKYHMMPNI